MRGRGPGQSGLSPEGVRDILAGILDLLADLSDTAACPLALSFSLQVRIVASGAAPHFVIHSKAGRIAPQARRTGLRTVQVHGRAEPVSKLSSAGHICGAELAVQAGEVKVRAGVDGRGGAGRVNGRPHQPQAGSVAPGQIRHWRVLQAGLGDQLCVEEFGKEFGCAGNVSDMVLDRFEC